MEYGVETKAEDVSWMRMRYHEAHKMEKREEEFKKGRRIHYFWKGWVEKACQQKDGDEQLTVRVDGVVDWSYQQGGSADEW
ncbi:hypothetical protein CEXT_586391 [Caerostris extrusa]|uniref:Uncharacterized protein n=1 Tax=Caerostris extrusa TaxID=172846 RepID=A0AAV4RF32_CAEEX|nr:hypothetical protein CEXT_586391 [Caerostris extrusa]